MKLCKICGKQKWNIDGGGTGQDVCDCPEPAPVSMLGWECPRCRKIHSPWSMTCDCPPPTGDVFEMNNIG